MVGGEQFVGMKANDVLRMLVFDMFKCFGKIDTLFHVAVRSMLCAGLEMMARGLLQQVVATLNSQVAGQS